MTVSFDDLEAALDDPNFEPSKVIAVLQLPRLGVRECRVVSLAEAYEVLDDIVVKTQQHISGPEVKKLKVKIAAIRARRLVAILKITADGMHHAISVEGLDVRPMPQA